VERTVCFVFPDLGEQWTVQVRRGGFWELVGFLRLFVR
jgi:hypothetical protein